jgi:hypothetical protein
MFYRRHHVHVNEAAGLCRATGTPARSSRYFTDGALSLLTVDMATLTFFRWTRWAGFGAVAATVSVVALRNAAVILDHAVTIGMSAILFGHTNTLSPFMIARTCYS